MLRKNKNVNDILLSKDVFILNGPMFPESQSKTLKNRDAHKGNKTVNSFYNSIDMTTP